MLICPSTWRELCRCVSLTDRAHYFTGGSLICYYALQPGGHSVAVSPRRTELTTLLEVR